MEEIGKILPKILKPQFSRSEPPVVEVLAPLWSQVAGKLLAKECRPVEFSTGTLTLSTMDPEWVVPLQQMAEEICAHVNNFLGRPVVSHLRIVCAGKHVRSDRSQPLAEGLAVSRLGLSAGQDRVIASGMPQAIGRSRVKTLARKRGKVH